MSDSSSLPIKAISLLSGGLDSILATRLVQDQGVRVLALHFITPFFGDDKRGREDEIAAFYRDTFGITMRMIDVADEYLSVLGDPKYGYGKNFNPCIDCKIFLLEKATDVMHAEGARFLLTGEVLGQRPMSQRRDAMNAVANQSGVRELLLRPLCAKNLPITKPEREGWVDRNRLCDFRGRTRKPQMALAVKLGIADYPTPAGGCSLTDPILAKRVEGYFARAPAEQRRSDDLRLILHGRPFLLPRGGLFTMGRNHAENGLIEKLARPGDRFAHATGPPGPLGLLRPGEADDRAAAAAVLLRYCPKAGPDTEVAFGPIPDVAEEQVAPGPMTPADLEAWRI